MTMQFAQKVRNLAGLPKILCCQSADEGDPWRFEENSRKYKAMCGLIHVKYLASVCVIIKCFILGYFTAERILQEWYMIFNVVISVLLLLTIISSAFLLIGIIVKKYTFIIPYFTTCVVIILLVVMKLFVDLINTANTKDTLRAYRLRKLIVQGAFLAFEVYTATIVWRVFGYITDFHMEKEFIFHSKLIERRRQNEALRERTDEEKTNRSEPQITFSAIFYEYHKGKCEVKQLNEQDMNANAMICSHSDDSVEVV